MVNFFELEPREILISELPRADRRPLSNVERARYIQNVQDIMAYAAHASQESAVLDSGSVSEVPRLTRGNQSALEDLLYDNHLRIVCDMSLSASGDPHFFAITLSGINPEQPTKVKLTATGRVVETQRNVTILGKRTIYKEEQLVFSVTFSEPEQQVNFLELLTSIGIDTKNDTAFTDSLALYLNINYLKFIPTPDYHGRLAQSSPAGLL